eukprot:CAMPEP_0176428634 /NCGR_PEP_ID=MMETSP0127-20121128/13260_1 /TAXON_ID=938130 /ORGANISM="Platyophrya macrostoma, Strain WH" /LENGTH=204 /DNA_ID=CAMNT_0017810341 /DNA_START=31 /DNA_END=646 /DNA_ORIENTATION=+
MASQARTSELNKALSAGQFNAKDISEYLKQRLISGERADATVLLKALLLALNVFTTHEFQRLLALVPAQVQESTEVKPSLEVLREMEKHLERCTFEKFWESYEKRPSALPVPATFETSIRQSIARVLADSVVSVSCERLTKALNVNISALPNLLRDASITAVVDGQQVIFEKNEYNFPRASAVSTEKLTLQRSPTFACSITECP